MPATSIDTFFACSLMVLLVLSAMASTTKLLYPHIDYSPDQNTIERYREVSEYLLLNAGAPPSWGRYSQTKPTRLGLARADLTIPYDLDIDKVTRLNGENRYSLNYAQLFTALGIPDVSFRIEIRPVFEVIINLTATYANTNQTTYQFELTPKNHGVPVHADLKCYAIVEGYIEKVIPSVSSDKSFLNVIFSNTIKGPALLVVFAKSIYDDKLVSFNVHAFAHNSSQLKPNGTYLDLSSLNHTLYVSPIYTNITVSGVHALTYSYDLALAQTADNNQTTEYNIPNLADPSPMLITATGSNFTTTFIEHTTYPQIPLKTGAQFQNVETRSNIFAYTYLITINQVIYECTIWLGGPRD